MPREGTLAVYVTSHGFGHLNRTVAALNRVPDDVPILIHGHPNLFDHWRERLRRPAELKPHVSDAGAVNPPGDSASTDPDATMRTAAQTHTEAMARLDEFTAEIEADNVAAVLCDATPIPLIAAKRAGVPGFLLANFTWSEIYAPYADALGGNYPLLVREIFQAYRHATAIFRASPALPMAGIAPLIEVGMVVTPGRDRRDELRRRLGLTDQEKLVYMYLGRYGQDNLEWGRLTRMGANGIHFVGFHPAPEGVEPPPNLHVVPAEAWTGADLAASADVVVAKAGYGSTCEAMVAGTPMIYPPRFGFAEHKTLAGALNTWGGGIQASRRAFERLQIEPLLDRAFALEPGPPPFPNDGAARVAEHLTGICRGRSWPAVGS